MHPHEAVLGDSGDQDRMHPRVGDAAGDLGGGGLGLRHDEPLQQVAEVVVHLGPGRRLVVHHDLLAVAVAHGHGLASDLAGVALAAAYPIDQQRVQAADVACAQVGVTSAPEVIHRVEGPQVVEELPLGVAQRALRGAVGGQLEGLLQCE